jgi:Tfp pilus assembly protein PilF
MKTNSFKNKLLKLYLLCPFLALLASCTSIDQPVTTADSKPEFPNIFSEKPEMAALGDIHQLSPEQEDDFLGYFNDPANQLIAEHQRLANYLANNNFLYEYETYTASEALAYNRGNCMSLAVVTTALANLIDIQIDYELIDSSPIYRLSGSVANRGVHIRSLIYKPEADESELRTGIKIDYFPADSGIFIGNVSDDEYIAMYYRNIAAQKLNEENYSDAYWYTLESMKYDPFSADAFNMMAITYKRVGQLAKAEEIYLYGIETAEDKLTLMKNYHILLTSQGRTQETRAINRRLLNMDDPSPIHWFNVARNSYETNDYNSAIRYYSRALDIAPYLHEAYLGIAISYYQLGQFNRAERAFNMALSNVIDASTKDLYQSKLNALRSIM